MLVSLGATRSRPDDLIELLAACHRRIRHHLVLARRLAAASAGTPSDEIRTVAAQVARYFRVALPLHVADEDLAIAPRLASEGDEVAAALRSCARDHVDHQPLLEQLIALCTELEREPSRLPGLAARLSAVVESLATELANHLELEERVVFPAIRRLPDSERAAIVDAIRHRREEARGA